MRPGVVAFVRQWLLWPVTLACALATAVLHVTLLVVVLGDSPDLHQGSGEALTVVDRRGEVLAIVPAIAGQTAKASWTSIHDIPPIALSMVVESEDSYFWSHGGMDLRGVLRATWLNLRQRGLRYGGSTLTMQVARQWLGTTRARSWRAKSSEAVLAMQIERRWTKQQILEQWFNRAYFGRGAYGFRSAALQYFGKDPRALSDAEAALLAVLPRAPSAYDPYSRLPAALARRDRLLTRLGARGNLSLKQVTEAQARVTPGRFAAEHTAPHFVQWVLEQLPADVREQGGTVVTTLDLALQRRLEQTLALRMEAIAARDVAQAGLVVLDTRTSDVLAMIGSRNWDGEDGQINIAARRRNPGSALKPFVYAAAIEQGDGPYSVAFDVRDVSESYVVHSAGVEHGPVSYREALAGSYNFAAIDVLERVGIGRVMDMLRRAEVARLDGSAADYGVRLALGSAKVRLVDLTAGYGFLVRGGMMTPARAVTRVTSRGTTAPMPSATTRPITSGSTAWLTMDILADRGARARVFGLENPFDLPFPVAAKTGTMRGFADTIAIAATEQVLVGAWAGNFDGSPSAGVLAMDAAAPLVRDALLAIHARTPLTLPPRPPEIVSVQVCALSGQLPGPACPHKREWAHHRHRPTTKCQWHDTNGSLTYPPRARGWRNRQGSTDR